MFESLIMVLWISIAIALGALAGIAVTGRLWSDRYHAVEESREAWMTRADRVTEERDDARVEAEGYRDQLYEIIAEAEGEDYGPPDGEMPLPWESNTNEADGG